MERIIDFVQDDEGGLYRIRWKGFGAKDDTWEPESNLFCEGLIEKFKRDLVTQKNVDTKELRESPKKTKRLVNECYPRTNMHNRIERSSKRSAAKNRWAVSFPPYMCYRITPSFLLKGVLRRGVSEGGGRATSEWTSTTKAACLDSEHFCCLVSFFFFVFPRSSWREQKI